MSKKKTPNDYLKQCCITEEEFKNAYEIQQLSFPEINKKYGLNSHACYSLLRHLNIPIRSISDSLKTDNYRKKNIASLKEKYGVENPSQLNWVKEKKKLTFQNHYGVDNIWKHKKYHKWLDEWYSRKYGVGRNKYVSEKSKNVWKSKTEEEKIKWLSDSIHSENSFKKIQSSNQKGYNKSKLEDRICLILNRLQVIYQRPFFVKVNNKKRYFYDFLLKEINLIIEINGDYWHANPSLYNENELIHYKFDNICAKDIWNKDKKKIEYAHSLGYKTLTLWESDMKKLTDEELAKELLTKIKYKP